MAMRTAADNPYLNLKDKDGGAVSIGDGYYITSLAGLTLGWKVGDTVTVYNPLSMEESEIEIAGVIQNNVQKSIITSRKSAAELMGLDENGFNCIICDTALPVPESKVAQEICKSDITDQMKTMTGQMDFLLKIIIVLASSSVLLLCMWRRTHSFC